MSCGPPLWLRNGEEAEAGAERIGTLGTTACFTDCTRLSHELAKETP